MFGICGHGNVGMLDALYQARDKIKLVSPRHEQVAAHMADAYFRVRHEAVATLTSCGPGSANIVMPLALALSNSSALLAITANVPTQQFNRSPFQEINRHYQADFPNVIRPVVKRSFQPTRVDMLPLALRQATTTMLSGRPGPVNVDVPFNVFQEEDDVEVPTGRAALRSAAQRRFARGDCRRVDMILWRSGRSCSSATASRCRRQRRADRARAPARHSGDLFAERHGLHRHERPAVARLHRPQRRVPGQPGRPACRRGDRGRRALRRPLGFVMAARLFVEFPHTKLIHVDVDPEELGRNYPPDIGILADARTFLRQLLAELERRRRERDGALKSWHAEIKEWQAEWETFTRPNFDIHATPIRPERVVADCQAVLPDDAILACDVGVNHNWYMQFWKARRPQTMLNSWGFSGMGFGAAGALGAKLAAPDRRWSAIAGDGCFTMVPHVLCTAVEYDIPVVWVIWNNFAWASIRDIQVRHVRRARARHRLLSGCQQQAL